jgi:Phage regulatory protein CII (CP76)
LRGFARDGVTGMSGAPHAGTASLGRPHGTRVYLQLKAAARGLVKKAGGQESAAAITRAGHQTLSRYGLPDDPSFMPVDVVADLEADVGAPEITRVLADLAGYLLVAKPPSGGRDPTWIARLSALAKESGEVISALGQALGDGAITPEEIRDQNLRREVREASEVLASIDAALKRIEAEDDAGSAGRGGET